MVVDRTSLNKKRQGENTDGKRYLRRLGLKFPSYYFPFASWIPLLQRELYLELETINNRSEVAATYANLEYFERINLLFLC